LLFNVVLFIEKRSKKELTSKTVDLLQEDSCFSELVSKAGASLPANGSSVLLCKFFMFSSLWISCLTCLLFAMSVQLCLFASDNIGQ